MSRITLEQAKDSKSWNYLEAIRLLEKIEYKTPKKGYVLFETGYGPSGLPHIGTFGEVARTTFVIKAFKDLAPEIPVKLICFSDDMDGMRKVPSNLPNQEMLKNYIGMPLTSIPDPFGEEESFGHYMNKKLRSFLDSFNFNYEFCSATEFYKSGKFDHMLLMVMEKYDEIMEIMLPTFREERKATYSPFMPICSRTGKVLQVPILEVKKDSKTIVYKDEEGNTCEHELTGGRCKLQWKPDFGMRWSALSVDYEMYGKDHMPNAEIYSNICKVLDGVPPVQFFYELFLDETGAKISKSKGEGITIDEWLKYAPIESLSLYMYQSPSRAKKLCFDVIPKNVDEYLIFNSKYHDEQDLVKKLANPVHFIHESEVPKINNYGLSFSLLLNLASACNPDNPDIMWGFIKKYAPLASKDSDQYLNKLVECSINYYNDFIKPKKHYIVPNDAQIKVLKRIITYLDSIEETEDAQNIQNNIYSIGMENYSDLKVYFADLYQILLGQKEGPRLGSFIKLFGISNSKKLFSIKCFK
jgi:lysyl-tRNA synthetase, class I